MKVAEPLINGLVRQAFCYRSKPTCSCHTQEADYVDMMSSFGHYPQLVRKQWVWSDESGHWFSVIKVTFSGTFATVYSTWARPRYTTLNCPFPRIWSFERHQKMKHEPNMLDMLSLAPIVAPWLVHKIYRFPCEINESLVVALYKSWGS